MKILIISEEIKNLQETIIVDAITELFKNNNIEFSISINDINDVDCILLLNKGLLNEASSLKAKLSCPLVYMFYKSNSNENYYIDTTHIDYTFIIKDSDIKILYPHPYLSHTISMIFDLETNKASNNHPNYDILISTNERMFLDGALLKIIRVINKLTQYKIKILSSSDELKNILNSNITICNEYNDIERYVAESKLVIGSGFAITYAIKHKKPNIVIGEKGYGGILNDNNFKSQYKSFFQGAVGARYDGAIPEKLLLEDIYNLFSQPYNNQVLLDLLYDNLNNTAKQFIDKLMSIIISIRKSNSNPIESELIFNSDYTIIKGNNKYWLLNRFTRKIIANLNDEYYSTIKLFTTKDNIYKQLVNSEIVQDLVNEKILVPAFTKIITNFKF